jgi:serine/threonine protein kinase
VERFGRYVLLEKLATGGMGEVYRAAAVGTAGFAKPLAIKRILPHLAEQQDFVNMLIDEAKISASLNHPNILQVLDLGKHQGLYFIAMEFVAGQPLNRVVGAALRNQVRLPLEFCWQVIMDALKGLAFAHEKQDALGRPMGIIHRDISPGNLMVGYDGTVKLADFGIAKAAQRSTHTNTGNVKGKPGYFSPEQVKGEPTDQRLDLYAMGVVLFEMLAMKRMRKAETDLQVLMEVAEGTIPPLEPAGLELPDGVRNVVTRALQPIPDNRFQSAREFLDAMAAVAREHNLGWEHLQVAGLMLRLFPVEMETERQAQAHYGEIIQQAAEADADEISDILSRAAFPTPTTSDFMTPTGNRPAGALSPPQSAGPPWKWLAGGGAALLLALGVGGLALRGPATGHLAVETVPPGATVSVGGQRVSGVSPVALRALPPGPVDVEIRLAGHQAVRQLATVEPGTTATVSITLKPDPVEVRITSTPPGADCSLDGRTLGRTPVTVTLDAPRSTLVLRLPDHQAFERVLERAAAPGSVNAVLTPVPPATAARPVKTQERPARAVETGLLNVESRPWGRIVVDGQDTGRFTPASGIKLSSGKHTVELKNNELNVSARSTVVIRGGATTTLSVQLK